MIPYQAWNEASEALLLPLNEQEHFMLLPQQETAENSH